MKFGKTKADVVNAVGVVMRTTAEVREKWKSLHSQATKELTELAKINFVFNCGTFVVCRRSLEKGVLFHNQGQDTSVMTLVTVDCVAYNLKEI